MESAILQHPSVAEVAVVGYEHPIKGQGIYAYVSLTDEVEGPDALKRELLHLVRDIIGAFATPDVIHWCVHADPGPNPGPTLSLTLTLALTLTIQGSRGSSLLDMRP